MQNITISQDTTLTANFDEYPSVIVKDTIIHDTIKVEVPIVKDTIVHDTVKIDNLVHDTIYITKTDTIYLQTAVSEVNAIGVKIYPNPTVSFVTVDADAEFSFVLTDIKGKLLRKEENAASYLLDLSEYSEGVYLLNTSDGATHKIVKE